MTTPQTDLRALAREIGTVRDVAASRYVDGNDHAGRDQHQMLARLDEWRTRILAALAGAETPQGMDDALNDAFYKDTNVGNMLPWREVTAICEALKRRLAPPPAVAPPALVALVQELQATYPLVGRTRTDSGLERYEAALADVLAWTPDAAAPPVPHDKSECPVCADGVSQCGDALRERFAPPVAAPAVEPMPKIEVGDVIIMEGHGRPMAALVVESDDIEYTVQHQEFAERVSQRRVHGVARVIWRREG